MRKIVVYFTDDQLMDVDDCAERRGMSRSTFIRTAAMQYAGKMINARKAKTGFTEEEIVNIMAKAIGEGRFNYK